MTTTLEMNMWGEDRSRFLSMINTGIPVALAAAEFSVTRKTGYEWLREATGTVPMPPGWEPGGRALTLADREEIAIGVATKTPLGQIGARIGRDKSVVSREIRRGSNADGTYRAMSAHRRAFRRYRRPKTCKLFTHARLWEYVREKLGVYWSPQQISARLILDYPDDQEMRVSHETIYHTLYVQAKGELKKDLTAKLRTKRSSRQSRTDTPSSGAPFLPDRVSISERPAEAADRAVPGHWEGDLIMGAGNQSAIGTLVERSTRFVLLLHLPRCRNLEGVRDAMIDAIGSLPVVMRRTVTWDQGIEMGKHAQITAATGMEIYFCDPHSPWQRGSNENTNGLLRQYFPKGTDLSVHTPEDLRRVQDELNGRPRETLGFRTPTEVFHDFVASTP